MTRRLPSPQLAFVAVGAILGAALLAVSPPFRWGDENTHFRQAFRLSEGDLGAACSSAGPNSTAPVAIVQLVYFTSVLHRKPKVSRKDILGMRGLAVRRDDRVPSRIDRAPYTPLPYAAQAVAIAAASLGTRSALELYYAARIGNFLGWLAVTWLAIRLAPSHGWSLAVLALTPISVFLATVCSVDATANALAFLWTAYVLRVAAVPAQGIERQEVYALAAIAVALTLTKYVYGLLIPFALLIPSRRAGGRLRLLGLVALLVALSSAAMLGWLALAGRDCLAGAAITTPASVARQWRSLVDEPTYFLGLLRDTTRHVWRSLMNGLVEPKWAVAIPLADSRLLFYAVVLAFVCDDRHPGWPSLTRRAVALGVAVAGFVAVVLIAFVYWTQAGKDHVAGFQMRYMLPLLPPLLVALEPPPLRLQEWVRRLGGCIAIAIVAALLVRTIGRALTIFTP